MKRIALLIVIVLCVLTIVPASAEIVSEDVIEFPTFSFSVAPGSYLIRGTEAAGYLFVCYPEYQNGNASVSISASQDTLIEFNPATMESIMRDAFGMTLLTQLTEQMKTLGFSISDATFSWGYLLDVDGQTGIILKTSMQIGANGQNTWNYNCSYMVCAGDYRYNFTVATESEEHSEILLRNFLNTLHWKSSAAESSVRQTSSSLEEEVLGSTVFFTVLDGKTTPSELLESNEGFLAALFFLDLEKNPEVKKAINFQLDDISAKNIYAGLDKKNRAFSAFPELLSDKYLIVALDGKNIVKLGMFTDNSLNIFLSEAKVNKPVDFYFFLGSYQGICSGIGLDPAPYNK